MGNKHSDHHHGGHDSESSSPKPAATTEETSTKAAATGAAAAPAAPVPDKVDVLVASTTCAEDMALAKIIKEALEAKSIPVYVHCQAGDDEAKVAGKLLVDCKCMVYIASNQAAKNNVGQDLISLAYISNKTILVAAEAPKNDLLKEFVVGMKMTLHQVKWTTFDVDPTNQVQTFAKEIETHISATEPAQDPALASVDSSLIQRRGGRLNTKLRQQSTIQDLGITQPSHIGNFWERNFEDEDQVPWYKFQKAFLDDYESKLKELLGEENIQWLLEMLKSDVFEGAEKVTKDHFMQVRGESSERNAFWSVVSQIAIEKFNMKEVFNMHSSVRLTAIEKLGQFQSPAVIEALMKLLEDRDPNVRAVAAICLGRTGCTDNKVVDRLIDLLKDGDRIVRQSACLSLGAMKAVKAIPHIGNIWRNDFISVVRNAARTALENMKIPEAQEVLSVTKVLEDEIAALEGNQAAV